MSAARFRGWSAGGPSDVTAALASVFGALTVAVAAAFWVSPELRPWLIETGGLLDWFSTAALIAALVVGAWSARRSVDATWGRFVVPGVAAWALLESFSYGLKTVGPFSFDIAGVEVSSLADLGRAGGVWATRLDLSTGLGITGLVLIALASWSVMRATAVGARQGLRATETRVIAYLILAGTLLITSVVVSVFGPHLLPTFASRLLWMTGSTAMVLAASAAADHRRTVAGWRSRMQPWLAERRSGPIPEWIDG